MKRTLSMMLAVLLLSACAPVLNREVMKEGLRDVPLKRMRESSDVFKGKLFILGGIIVSTKVTEEGTQIEALYVPVDSLGYLKEGQYVEGRFLAVYPRAKGMLDPVVYKSGKEITLAGEFIGTRNGKIDEMEYTYPVFDIRQIYLWDEYRNYYYGPAYPYYPYYYNAPFMYDPWGRPYPNPYWPGPW